LCHVNDDFSLDTVTMGYKHNEIISGKAKDGESIVVSKTLDFDVSIKIGLMLNPCPGSEYYWLDDLTITGEDYGKGQIVRRFGVPGNPPQYAVVYEVN
jgi:hypothetical protein